MYVKYVMSTETPYLDKIFIENLIIGVKKKSSNFGITHDLHLTNTYRIHNFFSSPK